MLDCSGGVLGREAALFLSGTLACLSSNYHFLLGVQIYGTSFVSVYFLLLSIFISL